MPSSSRTLSSAGADGLPFTALSYYLHTIYHFARMSSQLEQVQSMQSQNHAMALVYT
jgi:hypothetical protein